MITNTLRWVNTKTEKYNVHVNKNHNTEPSNVNTDMPVKRGASVSKSVAILIALTNDQVVN